jgi:polyisoprenoid-binding protein YceI
VSNLSSVNFLKDGVYPVNVEGDLTFHGVTKQVNPTGSLTIKAGKIVAVSKFQMKLKDFNVSIPSLVADKISQEIDIIVECNYELKK